MTESASSHAQAYPEPTVGALIVNKEGKVLLVSSHKWFDKLTVPGGHVEIGETLEEAVVRETKEEVGLDVQVAKLLLTQQAIYSPEFWKKRHFIFFDYLCRTGSDEVRLDNRELQDYVWAWPGAALGMNLESFSRRLLEKYLSAG